MEIETSTETLAELPLRELQFTHVPEAEGGLLPRVLLLPHGATAVGFEDDGELTSVVLYRTTGMPGAARYRVDTDVVTLDLEATRPAPGEPLEVYDGAESGSDLEARMAHLGQQLEAASSFVQRVEWRTPPGLGQTSMHHNHRLGLMADRVMASDIGRADISWLGLIGPLKSGASYRTVDAPVMRDFGARSLARVVASLRGDIETRSP